MSVEWSTKSVAEKVIGQPLICLGELWAQIRDRRRSE